MTLNDNAVLTIGAGNFFRAAVGTPMPAGLNVAPGSAWSSFGHTALEDVLSITSEGGEATTIGTLQNRSLRTTYSPRTDTIAVPLQQLDAEGLKLYYGSNMVELDNDLEMLGVPVKATPTTAAFLAIFIDDENYFGLYAPKAEIFRADDIDFGDDQTLVTLPLGVKPMVHNSNDWTYAVTPLGGDA